MEIREVTAKVYKEGISNPYHIFNSSAFNDFNSEKCDKIYYLQFRDTKIRLAIVFGVKNNALYSPFSSPFGGFDFSKDNIRIQTIDNAIALLKSWSIDKGYTAVNITLPPSIYHESFISKQSNSLFRAGFNIDKKDLNYSFSLNNFNENYTSILWRNARKNLNSAIKNNFSFKLCESDNEKEEAYNTIKINRKERGFPLKMSWENVKKTIQIIDADFFLVKQENNNTIGGAMVFYVSHKIVQVIYWGDLPEYSHLKTMNYLSYKIFEHYKKLNVDIIDIGPSTENSIPNYGLCEFKESIGCDITTKLSFKLEN